MGLANASASTGQGKICSWRRETNTWHEVPLDIFLSFFEQIEISSSERNLSFLIKKLRKSLVKRVKKTLKINDAPGKWGDVYEKRKCLIKKLPILPTWSASDSLLLADSTWNQPGLISSLCTRKDCPRIIGLIYDTIQLERPDFVGELNQKTLVSGLLR